MLIKQALVVDDSKVTHIKLQRLLRSRAIETHWAVNGGAGLHFLRQHPVDLLFMNLMMPGMDGFETIQAMYVDRPGHRPPPIVVCSSSVADEDVLLAWQLGAVAFMPISYLDQEMDQVLAVASALIQQNQARFLCFSPHALALMPTPWVRSWPRCTQSLNAGEIVKLTRKVVEQQLQTALLSLHQEVSQEVTERVMTRVVTGLSERLLQVSPALGQSRLP